MRLSSWVDNAFQSLAIDERRKPFQPSIWNQGSDTSGQVLEQVWFAGVHSNVGGSYPRAGLSDITLLWMIGKAEACGLAIDRNCLATLNNPKPNAFDEIYNSQTVWYKIAGLGDYVRPMGRETEESAASSAIDRLENPSSDYHPPNLTDFRKRGGDVTHI